MNEFISKREFQTKGVLENTENKPIRTNRDHEDYFTARFECPHCGAKLGSYSYGRSWCNGQKEEFISETLDKCCECGNELDWSELN